MDIFNLGTTLDGHVMNDATRTAAPTQPDAPDYGPHHDVTYVYGECVGGSRLPPLEVQSSPLTEKHWTLYNDDGLLGQYPFEEKTIKGVPAAFFDGGTTVEIYTAATTVTLYGDDPALVLRAAEQLRPALSADIPRVDEILDALSPEADEVPVPESLPAPDLAVLGPNRTRGSEGDPLWFPLAIATGGL